MYDLGVFDHSIISIELCLFPPSKPKCHIHFCNMKNINYEVILSDQFLASVNSPSINESVDHCFSRIAPLFTGAVRKMKAAVRAIERPMKTSGFSVYRLAYKEHWNAYAKMKHGPTTTPTSSKTVQEILKSCFTSVFCLYTTCIFQCLC